MVRSVARVHWSIQRLSGSQVCCTASSTNLKDGAVVAAAA
jgi:hypothetical protein